MIHEIYWARTKFCDIYLTDFIEIWKDTQLYSQPKNKQTTFSGQETITSSFYTHKICQTNSSVYKHKSIVLLLVQQLSVIRLKVLV